MKNLKNKQHDQLDSENLSKYLQVNPDSSVENSREDIELKLRQPDLPDILNMQQ